MVIFVSFLKIHNIFVQLVEYTISLRNENAIVYYQLYQYHFSSTQFSFPANYRSSLSIFIGFVQRCGVIFQIDFSLILLYEILIQKMSEERTSLYIFYRLDVVLYNVYDDEPNSILERSSMTSIFSHDFIFDRNQLFLLFSIFVCCSIHPFFYCLFKIKQKKIPAFLNVFFISYSNIFDK